MPKISAVINTRNEQDNIRYCLETVKWCDEIIVVDMESEDKTVEIAREYTDKIYFHEKVLAFDVARKYAVEKATGDWILLIDADEMVPRVLAQKLMEITEQDGTDIVEIPFKTYIMGAWIRYTAWWPEYHPRFFRRGTIEFVETIHNYMQISELAKKLVLEPVEENAIVHFNYRDAAHFIEKLNRYTTIEAKHLFDRGAKPKKSMFFRWPVKEFALRYFRCKGYKDGYRGFFLSVMMGFYKFLTLIKLWELYKKQVEADYDYKSIRKKIMDSFRESEGQ